MTAERAMQDGYQIYAYTENGREIREVTIRLKSGQMRKRYCVQPKTDNYWLMRRTPEAALRAFYGDKSR